MPGRAIVRLFINYFAKNAVPIADEKQSACAEIAKFVAERAKLARS